jgi:hypothetical protein
LPTIKILLPNRNRYQNPFGDAVGHVVDARDDGAVLKIARERVSLKFFFDCMVFVSVTVTAATDVFRASIYVNN